MNVWRWLGISLFVLGAVCLISTTKFPALAGGAKTTTTATGKTTTTDTGKTTTTEDPKKKVEPTVGEKPPVPVEKKGELAFKAFLDKAPVFYQEQKTVTDQTMKVQNQDVKQHQEQTFMIQWTPQAPDKDGNWVVKQKIVGVKMEINIGGNNIKYESTAKNNPKNPMTDFFGQLTQAELTFTIEKDLSKVIKVEGGDKYIKGLSDINPQMTSLLKAILDDKALKHMAEPTWWAYPPGGVLTDKPWTKSSDLDLGPIGKYKSNFTFTHKEVKDGKDEITIATNLQYEAPAAAAKAGLPFIIHKADLKSEKGSGKAIFNRAAGRFDSIEIDMELKGDLTIEVGNMQTTVNLTQTQKSISKTHAENPWK